MVRPRQRRGRCPDTAETHMNHLTDLIDRYIAMWNETDSERRREIIARVWTRNASYVDPVLQGEGQAEIDAMVKSVQERFPGHKFRRTSAVDVHHDRVRFGWELGTDCGVVAGGKRLQAITGFFDRVAQPAA